MRLKLQIEPPFSPLKAWFPVPPHIHSILDLKFTLITNIKILVATEIELFLDDFELLDETDVNVLRDGDLVRYAYSTCTLRLL